MCAITAQRLLRRLLELLPKHRWWIVRKKIDSDLVIVKTIDALLINTSTHKETGNGFSLKKNKWESFCETLPGHFEVVTKGKVFYISNGRPHHKSPAGQEKSGAKDTARRTLDADTQAELELSTRSYVEKKAAALLLRQAKIDAEEKKRREDAAKKAAATKRKVLFPVLSQIISAEGEISLNNPVVEEWCKKAFAEIVELHAMAGRTLRTCSMNGKEKSFLPIARSSGCKNFMINASRSQWLKRAAELGADDGMTDADSASCMIESLAKMFPAPKSESTATAPDNVTAAEAQKDSNAVEVESDSPPKKRVHHDVRVEPLQTLARPS